ncbi:MAG: glycosyltransferase [Gammaproteobacteria bacterium]|nr:glycosyltransferase [Gammaproteobacteria bacterium]
MDEATLITVALCTHNHADRLPKTLADLGKMAPPSRPWEIVIVDNGCTDGTQELLADTAWRPANVPVRIVPEESLGLSNARNRALKVARGNYLVFIDDDETPDPRWLVAYERDMLFYKPDALGGPIEVIFEHGERPTWLKDELLGFLGHLDHGEGRWLTDPATTFYGGNFAVRKDIFSQVGEFDSGLGRKGRINTGGEDTEFYRRLIDNDHSVRWVPEATIYHRIRADKLRRSYFLELHYRQGVAEGSGKRGNGSRLPPKYLFGQLARALKSALQHRFTQGKDSSLRLEMNVVYFVGHIQGWMVG